MFAASQPRKSILVIEKSRHILLSNASSLDLLSRITSPFELTVRSSPLKKQTYIADVPLSALLGWIRVGRVECEQDSGRYLQGQDPAGVGGTSCCDRGQTCNQGKNTLQHTASECVCCPITLGTLVG